MSTPMYAPLMMSVDEFARLHGISPSTAWECIRGKSKSYPVLESKEARKPGSRRSQRYITAEQAAAWRSRLPDA